MRVCIGDRCSNLVTAALVAALGSASSAGADTLFVDGAAPPGGNGGQWSSAFRFLQDALAAVPTGVPTEIRVAQGTQRPDESAAAPNGTGSKSVSFVLKSNVQIRGGYAGLAGRDPDARDPALYVTVLSGDLLGNDGPNFTNRSDNSVLVVSAGTANASAVLEGVWIRGGNSTGTGAGFKLNSSLAAPTLRECVITDNRASRGAAAWLNLGTATFERCRFIGNLATDNGGAFFCEDSGKATVRNSIIAGNTAFEGGAAHAVNANLGKRLRFIGCTIHANVATAGPVSIGGPAGDAILVRNSILSANQPSQFGGAVLQFSMLASSVPVDAPGAITFFADPMFVAPFGADGIAGSLDDDLRLSAGSPGIDAGLLSEPVVADELDLAGHLRLAGCAVDLGAFEREDSGPDCNGNGATDRCDLLVRGTDCDASRALDACEPLPDCDGNGLLDACETSTPWLFSTGQVALAPNPPALSWNVILPHVASDVTLHFSEQSTLNLSVTFIIKFNGVTVAQYAYPTFPCSDPPIEGTATISAATFNNFTGPVTVTMTRSLPSGPATCDGEQWFMLDMTAQATNPLIDCNGNGAPDACDFTSGTSVDCNGNSFPDECDIASGVSEDQNGNGRPDECDLLGDLDGDDDVDSSDLSLLLDKWGSCAGCLADYTDDGIVDGEDLAIQLSQWSR